MSFLLGDIQLLVDLVALVVDIIVKLFVEFVFDVLREIVVEILLGILWLWKLWEASEIWRVLETLHVHHIWELEIILRLWHLSKIIVVYLADVHISKLVDVVVGHLVNLTDLPRHLSKLLRRYHEFLLATSNKLLINVERLLAIALCVVNDVLNALMQVFWVFYSHVFGGVLGSENMLGHIDLLLIWLFVLMLHLELTIAH